MRRRRIVGLLGGAVIATLAWPSPVHAQTSLGGYSGEARAYPIRFEIVDPTIPLPSDPQVDFGIGYTRSTSETGPASRATASYLWPGDVLGDGFDQLTGQPGSTYPVQVNSRYPATTTAPTKNQAQLTDGNGMSTSSTEDTTRATVTGFGISNGGTNLLSGAGNGLCQALSPDPKNCPSLPATPPVPVPAQLAGVMTLANVHSESTVQLAASSITSTAEATASDISLFGGIIGIHDVKVTSSSTSNGVRASNTAHLTIGGVTVAGKDIGLDEQGLNLAGTSVPVPQLPDVLSGLGISFQYQPTTKSVDGATASFASTGLVISVDTALVKQALAPLTGALANILSQIPNLDQVTALLNLGPRFNFLIGDVSTTATAAPAYVPPPLTGGGSTTPGHGSTGGGTTGGGVAAGGTGGGSDLGGGGGTGTTGDTTPISSGTGAPTTTTGGGAPTTTVAQPAAFGLPPLGTVPKLLILGGLAFAVALGWAFRTAGGLLLGTGRNCAYGLDTGVPDLRQS